MIHATPGAAASPRRPDARRLALAALALLLCGCETALVLDLDLDDDGSGRVEVRVEADADAVAALDAAVADAPVDGGAADPLDVFAATVAELDGWEATEDRDGRGARTVAAATDVADPAEVAEVTAALADALDTAEGRLLGPVSVELGEDVLRLDGELAADVDPAAALGWATPAADLRWRGDPLDAVLAGDDAPVAARFTAELPGAVRESDADAVDGRRATWHLAPGEVRQVHVVAERDTGAWPSWLLFAAAVMAVLALVGALAAAVVWRGGPTRR